MISYNAEMFVIGKKARRAREVSSGLLDFLQSPCFGYNPGLCKSLFEQERNDNLLKIMSVFGTRPEASKMGPIMKVLDAMQQEGKLESVVCVTAQHRQLLDQMLKIFDIHPKYDLNLMKDRQTLAYTTKNALTGLMEVFEQEKPNLVLVHGDTTTTFAAALAAFYCKIKIGHVEAGLRTYDKFQPYPEEMNRKLTTALADLHFAPTGLAKEQLEKENVPSENIFVTGNTDIDNMSLTIKPNHIFSNELLNTIDYRKKIIAMTAHRQENLGEPLQNICKAVLRIVNENPDVEVIYSVHPNPVVVETANSILSNHERVHLIEPVDMVDLHNLINKSYLVLTDSGGIQEEAAALHKPTIVVRNVTERPEGVDAGVLVLAGDKEDNIVNIANRLLKDETAYKKMSQAQCPYGDGNASRRIVEAVLYYFGLGERPIDYV